MREPTPEIGLWDEFSGETACTAQLLYMHEMFNPNDKNAFADLDRMIGRPLGQSDLHFGNLRLILDLRFTILHVSQMDPARLIGKQGREYLRGLLIEDGFDQEQVDVNLADTHAMMVERTLRRQAITNPFKATYRQIVEKPSETKLTALIAQGCQVGCVIKLPNGALEYALVLGPAGPGQCKLFTPVAANLEDRITVIEHGELVQSLTGHLTGYYYDHG